VPSGWLPCVEDFIIELKEVNEDYEGPKFGYGYNALTRKYYTAKNPDYEKLVSLITISYGYGYSHALEDIANARPLSLSAPAINSGYLPNIDFDEIDMTKFKMDTNIIPVKKEEWDVFIVDMGKDKDDTLIEDINYIALPISNDVVPFIIKY
jgi:hypothetical protein